MDSLYVNYSFKLTTDLEYVTQNIFLPLYWNYGIEAHTLTFTFDLSTEVCVMHLPKGNDLQVIAIF